MSRRPPSAPPVPPLHVRVKREEIVLTETVFGEAFTIGRGEDADLRIEDGLVSRSHAEITFSSGQWWVRDLGSANGTFLDNERITEGPLPVPAVLELGQDGPEVHLEAAGASATSLPASADPSVTQVLNYYFSEDAGPAGEKTQMVREAYRRVHRTHRKRVYSIIGVGVLLVSVALSAALWQRARAQEERSRVAQLTALSDTLFAQMRAQEVFITRLRDSFGLASNSSLDSLVAQAEALRQAGSDPSLAGGVRWRMNPIELAAYIREEEQRRQAIESNYDRFVTELGVYRNATPREAAILKMARIFNESEVTVDAAFIAEVERYIAEWRRRGLGRIVRQAQQAGYDRLIAQTMRDHGLPAEFFYLALAESYFNPRAVGTPTRYGYAKGMWQFIPSTAHDFGLRTGPLVDEQIYDPADHRHDVAMSTRAAALYIRKLYSDLSQASGLLAMACYNWGEGNVLPKLRRLPRGGRTVAQSASPSGNETAAPSQSASPSGNETPAAATPVATDSAARAGTTPGDSLSPPDGSVPDDDVPPEDLSSEELAAELEATIEAQFANIPQDPQQRSYWRFLNTYRNRMPEETRNYVMRIFSAAVIGSDPQLFGFNFDNPLDF